MYVCICHQISEEKLERALESSAGTLAPSEALKKLGLGNSCGTCLISALEKVHAKIQSKQTSTLKRPKETYQK